MMLRRLGRARAQGARADELAGLRRQIAELERHPPLREPSTAPLVAAELAQLAEEKGTPARTRLVSTRTRRPG